MRETTKSNTHFSFVKYVFKRAAPQLGYKVFFIDRILTANQFLTKKNVSSKNVIYTIM